jgi:hypothetical protein
MNELSLFRTRNLALTYSFAASLTPKLLRPGRRSYLRGGMNET